MIDESRKILHAPELAVSATCVRVPVFVSHCVAAHLEFAGPVSPGAARELLRDMPGVVVQDDPAAAVYPMPLDAAGRDAVFRGAHPPGTPPTPTAWRCGLLLTTWSRGRRSTPCKSPNTP